MSVVESADWQKWQEKDPAHYGGDYRGENGSGGMSIYLWAYENGKGNQLGKMRYAGCVISATDIAVKPDIISFDDLEYSEKTEDITDGVVSFKPVMVKVADGRWVRGLVYNSVFFDKGRWVPE